jgi:hypothetical protein
MFTYDFREEGSQLIAATFPNTYLPECEYLTRTLSNDLDLFLAQKIEVGVTAKAKVAWPAGLCTEARGNSGAIPNWKDYILFYEYFHGDNGAGLGASSRPDGTGVVAKLIELFGRLEAQPFLDTGKPGGFAKGASVG